MYHGTNIERGKSILTKKRMEYSRGGNEWLGDGIYLYRDKLFAYRWIRILYKNSYGTYDPEKLYQLYMVLEVKIDYDYDRVFSLINPEHKVEYDKVKEECEKKKGLSKTIAGFKFVDGVVLNFMFKKMGYDKKYDMVEAIFPIADDVDRRSRFAVMGEYQLCVKNPERILDIRDCTREFKAEDYETRLKTVNSYRTTYNRSDRYSINKEKKDHEQK